MELIEDVPPTIFRAETLAGPPRQPICGSAESPNRQPALHYRNFRTLADTIGESAPAPTIT
jgi:hypothetical protein